MQEKLMKAMEREIEEFEETEKWKFGDLEEEEETEEEKEDDEPPKIP
jgi:hypothetical protein